MISRRPRATALIRWDAEGEAGLLVHADRAAIWVLPGGGIEPDEPPLAAVARELREEAGLTAVAAVLLFTHASAANLHHVFLVRAQGALGLPAPREVPAIGVALPDGRIRPILGDPGPPGGRQLTAGARAIMARFHSLAADHADLSATLDRLDLGDGAV